MCFLITEKSNHDLKKSLVFYINISYLNTCPFRYTCGRMSQDQCHTSMRHQLVGYLIAGLIYVLSFLCTKHSFFSHANPRGLSWWVLIMVPWFWPERLKTQVVYNYINNWSRSKKWGIFFKSWLFFSVMRKYSLNGSNSYFLEH